MASATGSLCLFLVLVSDGEEEEGREWEISDSLPYSIPVHCLASWPVGQHPKLRSCLLLYPLSLSTPCSAETCTGQDLADLGDRLRDWFQLLHENSKQNGSTSSGASPASGTRASCSAGRRVGDGKTGVHWGQPTLCSLLPDSEPLKEPKP